MREVARGRSPWDGRTDGLGSFCSPAVAPCGGRLAGEMQQGAAQGQGSARGGRNRREVKSGRRIWVVRLELQNCPPWQLLGLNWRGRRVARGRRRARQTGRVAGDPAGSSLRRGDVYNAKGFVDLSLEHGPRSSPHETTASAISSLNHIINREKPYIDDLINGVVHALMLPRTLL